MDEGSSRAEAVRDGRRRRAERSREKILDALERALGDPALPITPERISAEAGVSLSTLARHFGDLAGVTAAMRERAQARVMPHLAAGPFTGTTRVRVRELLRRRTAIFEVVGPLQRAALRQPTPDRDVWAEHLEMAEVLGAQVRTALEPELAGADEELLLALDAALSVSAWLHLYDVRGLSPRRIAEVLEEAVLRLLGDRVSA